MGKTGDWSRGSRQRLLWNQTFRSIWNSFKDSALAVRGWVVGTDARDREMTIHERTESGGGFRSATPPSTCDVEGVHDEVNEREQRVVFCATHGTNMGHRGDE